MPASEKGHADRNPGDAGHLRDLVWVRCAGVDGDRQLEDVGQCGAGGECLEGSGHEPNSTDRYRRSAAGNAFVLTGVSVRPGAHLVRDVARPPAAWLVLASSPQVQDAAR